MTYTPDAEPLTLVQYGRLHAHAIGLDRAVEEILTLVRAGRGGFVVTPNADHLCLAKSTPELVHAYGMSTLALPDGMPMVLLSRTLRLPVRERVAGADLLEPLVARAAEEGVPIYFLGSSAQTCERAVELLTARYPAVRIVGWSCPWFDAEGMNAEVELAIVAARDAGARLIIVAMSGPKQELLMHRYRHLYEPAVAIGTGAALDFLVGNVDRAPGWISQLGVEWVYRLVKEPRRLWRRYLVRDVGVLTVFVPLAARRLLRRPVVFHGHDRGSDASTA
jgi:exopolysaccharide biosynthesis WecB/TagA/CpsF family protein